ncbi:Glutathione synthase [Trinorchestia longiramus]|nr:Glutathione synthase [Trinorchestia longiramus]
MSNTAEPGSTASCCATDDPGSTASCCATDDPGSTASCCATPRVCTERSSRIPCCSIPLPLPQSLVKQLAADAKDFALLHGAGMRYKDSYSTDTLSMAPFFLLPTPFPRRDFEKVCALQPLINKLMHNVAHNHHFLQKALQNTIKADDFTRRLWEIYTTVREEGVAQPVSLGLLRSDVMLTECSPGCCLLCLVPPYVMNQQVEINTIASGFGHMGPVSARIHKFCPNIRPLMLSVVAGAVSIIATDGRCCHYENTSVATHTFL